MNLIKNCIWFAKKFHHISIKFIFYNQHSIVSFFKFINIVFSFLCKIWFLDDYAMSSPKQTL